jgi:hypothetical protein
MIDDTLCWSAQVEKITKKLTQDSALLEDCGILK